MITYIKNIIDEFIELNPEFKKATIAIGNTEDLEKLNLNDLPLLFVEQISYTPSNDYNNLIGNLNFELSFIDQNTKKNGYEELETYFTKKFNIFLRSKNELNISGSIEYFQSDKYIYGITYKLSAIFEL